MEENKLNYFELEKIYNKLEEIDTQLFYMFDNLEIQNNVRNGIIISMEEIRHILNQYKKIKCN